MRYFHKTQNQFHCPSINLDKVWTLVSDATREKYAEAKDTDKLPVIDVGKFVRQHKHTNTHNEWGRHSGGRGYIAWDGVLGVCWWGLARRSLR